MHRFLLHRVSFTFLVLLAFPFMVVAQKVSNVDANQEGKSIAITYDLSDTANISVYVSYDEGKTKTVLPKEYLSGDVGKSVGPGTNKKVLWHVLEQYPNQNFQGDNISFIVTGRPCMRFFAMANGGYSLASGPIIGVSVGQIGTIGWYLKGISTLSAPKTVQLECDGTGSVGGVYPAYSGRGNKFRAYGVAGLSLRLCAPIYLCAGAGYGVNRFDWETVDGQWVRYSPGSFKGPAFDAGLMTKFSSVAILAGVTYMGGSIDICFGLGWVF